MNCPAAGLATSGCCDATADAGTVTKTDSAARMSYCAKPDSSTRTQRSSCRIRLPSRAISAGRTIEFQPVASLCADEIPASSSRPTPDGTPASSTGPVRLCTHVSSSR